MAMTVAQFQAAFDVTGTGVDVGVLNVFKTGDIVYVRAELNVANQESFVRNRYEILTSFFKENSSFQPLDKNGVVAVGSTAASVATDNVTPDTAPEWPTFYRVRRVSDSRPAEFHESELLSLAGANSVRDANNWT